MINRDRIQLLVDTLRSGRFKQGTGKLVQFSLEPGGVRNEWHCCLGVACVLAVEGGATVSVRDNANAVLFEEKYGYMPPSVQDWFGFTGSQAHNPYVVPAIGTIRTLASLNDSGCTFETIAEAIENTWLQPEPAEVPA